MEVDDAAPAALETPGEPAFFCPLQVIARFLTVVLSQVPWTRLPRRLQVLQEPARCAALLIDALLLGVSLVCVFRVLIFVASLLCVLFWEPAGCVLLVAAQVRLSRFRAIDPRSILGCVG